MRAAGHPGLSCWVVPAPARDAICFGRYGERVYEMRRQVGNYGWDEDPLRLASPLARDAKATASQSTRLAPQPTGAIGGNNGVKYMKIALSDTMGVDAQIARLIEAKMEANASMTYREAASACYRDDPDIFEARERLRKQDPGSEYFFVSPDGKLVPIKEGTNDPAEPDNATSSITEVKSLVRTKIAASAGGMDYTGALCAVARENPQLWRQYRRDCGDEV
jgi:hypothetical protein